MSSTQYTDDVLTSVILIFEVKKEIFVLYD